jgi:two-component system sensor histidine kinase YesM
MVEDLNNLIRLVYEKEILQSRAELKALQAQVNPHFLFNTMEVLYRSLRQRGDRELAEFVITLSEFFRYTISRNQRDEWVTLEEEISHIEKYLQIMRKRLGVRLSWQIRLPQQLACVPIPKLLVQPIVENAIVHGIEEKIGEGKVTIAAWRKTKEEEIIIEVADDGVGMNGQALEALSGSIHTGDVPSAKGSGFGLANVERRLRLSYRYPPGTSSIQIDSREGEGTRVRITIPRERRET